MKQNKNVKVIKTVSWKYYENAVFQECKRVFNRDAKKIIKNAYMLGRFSGVKRQLDVLIRLKKEDGASSIIIVESKHYAQKINVKIVDSFVGCLEDVGAEKGIIVSEKGFTKAAINRAHKGKDDIEVDVLSLGELQRFQVQGALPYAGDSALTLSAPFGWIIDATRRGFAPAVLYQRGITFEEATGREKEWMYIQLWGKKSETDTLTNLIDVQNETLRNHDSRAEINVFETDGLMIRQAFLPSYPTPEITVFREYEWFIAFIVLFCPECHIDRDTKKAVAMLKGALPIHVIQGRV